MTALPRIQLVAFDAPDIERLSAFYSQLTAWPVTRQEDDWIVIAAPDGQEVAFQLAPDHVAPQWPGQEHPQQFHLDLSTDDLAASAARAEALGAKRVGGMAVPDGPSWLTLTDPAGHPFDLVHKAEVGPVLGLSGVTIDAPDAAVLAAFYRDLLGLQVGYEGAEGVSLSDGVHSLWIQPVENYNRPQWPDPEHPQQAHLDLLFDDLPAGRERVLELGGTVLKNDGNGFWVFADPAGHPFCLCTP